MHTATLFLINNFAFACLIDHSLCTFSHQPIWNLDNLRFLKIYHIFVGVLEKHKIVRETQNQKYFWKKQSAFETILEFF